MPQLSLDVFDGEAFKALTLTEWVNENVPFQPTFLSSLGLSAAEGVFTTDVAFEDVAGRLSLIATSPRGSAPGQIAPQKGNLRKVPTVRLAQEAQITADECRNVVVPSTMLLASGQRLLYKKIEGPSGIKANLSYTMENMLLGAVDGQVIDADGTSVVWDYFSIYGVSRPAAIALPLVASSYTTTTPLKTALQGLKRAMVKEMNGMVLAGARIVILCGDNFFDKVDGCAEVAESRKLAATGNTNAPKIISENLVYSSFVYGDCVFVNYRGSDDGAVAVDADEGLAFFMGVPGLFRTFFAPSDVFQSDGLEGTGEGLPSYIIQRRERQGESFRNFEVQSNPLVMNMRPKSSRRLSIAA